jgi:hypothetical protein
MRRTNVESRVKTKGRKCEGVLAGLEQGWLGFAGMGVS